MKEGLENYQGSGDGQGGAGGAGCGPVVGRGGAGVRRAEAVCTVEGTDMLIPRGRSLPIGGLGLPEGRTDWGPRNLLLE